MSLPICIELVAFPTLFSFCTKAITGFSLLLFMSRQYCCKVKKYRLLVVSMAAAFLDVLPGLIAKYYAAPEMLSASSYSLLLFANPFLILVLYPLLKQYVRMPAPCCAMIAKKAINYMNISICIFLLAQELIGGTQTAWGQASPYACVITIAFILALLLAIYAITTAKNIRFALPANTKSERRALFVAFGESAIIYALLVMLHHVFEALLEPFAGYPLYYICYAVLILAGIVYFILDIYIDMFNAQQHETKNLVARIAALNDANEQYRGIKHDINNMLQAYGYLIEMGDIAQLKKYHQSVFQATAGMDTQMDVSGPLRNYLPLYSLLLAKEECAKAQGIDMCVTFSRLEAGLPVSDAVLCRMMGILLDNATEASVKSAEKKLIVSFKPEEEEGAMFTISNTYEGIVNFKQIFAMGQSTKGDGRGTGLFELQKLIRKNRFLSLKADQNENMVTFCLCIKYA